jgi:hypothetical protein
VTSPVAIFSSYEIRTQFRASIETQMGVVFTGEPHGLDIQSEVVRRTVARIPPEGIVTVTGAGSRVGDQQD